MTPFSNRNCNTEQNLGWGNKKARQFPGRVYSIRRISLTGARFCQGESLGQFLLLSNQLVFQFIAVGSGTRKVRPQDIAATLDCGTKARAGIS